MDASSSSAYSVFVLLFLTKTPIIFKNRDGNLLRTLIFEMGILSLLLWARRMKQPLFSH